MQFSYCLLLLDFHQSTGTVTLTELKEVMKSLGQNPTDAELVEMINSVDDNGDNEIDFEEFLVLMKSRIGERDPDKELRDAFKVFDTDGSGSISRDELKRLMTQLGQNLSEAELDAMMDEVDTDGDGEISFEEGKGSFDFSVVRSIFIISALGSAHGQLFIYSCNRSEHHIYGFGSQTGVL